ncbi:TIGR03960 family B12-binding radical SAM protein [bacterium]|nr:TIGR03960 family B12-binding radical SAM protein [bacterium]
MNCFFRDQQEALYKATKPYQYVGGEFLSYNKDFDKAKVRFAFVFPDKYEIGISNLGVRVIYDRVNAFKRSIDGTNEIESPFMADRAYAPEPDFKPEFLYGVESKRALKDFDGVGFSLQYELSYPTVLKMLEMSGITVRNDERRDDEPIVLAGGPCCYNPLPMCEFIDVFCIGDGEEMMVDVCASLERTKGLPRRERIEDLCKIKGCWNAQTPLPQGSREAYRPVEKRLAPLTLESASTSYPIPFSSSVHDRAIVEIRRGCGRMCRFCQPGHVTLPVRERSAEDIITITKELVKNTGYDEYSLLSLSSNDYSNIKEVIKELAVDFNKKKISVSLPSQRIDGFNLELANLVQSVRKSGMTLAPEAGSQRLRNVIKKNISEEQIINAALTLYENGWSKIKFYFISGLPTETLEDMDEMAELLNKIKYRARLIKREKELKHGFEITCTLSIFVPKPFTPFQWCPQMDLDKVTEHIHYLKEKTKHIKGLKINYHEKFVSQIEAALTRGDASLCKYIEALYKKGCYLDAWGEYFDKNVWAETAKECGFTLEDYARKSFDLDEVLPWYFINTGLKKEWLQNEYREAMKQGCEFNLQPTCENKCVQCGVCPSLKTHKVMAKPYKASEEAQKIVSIEEHRDPTRANVDPDIPVYRYRLKVTKKGLLRYFSHLDWQSTFHKVLARSGLNMVFSLGFNPTMKVSMGVALPLFAQSEGELVDIEIYDNLTEKEVMDAINPKLPEGAKIVDVKRVERYTTAVDIAAQWAEYCITPYCKSNENYDFEEFKKDVERVLTSPEILISKKNKKGIEKTTDFKKSVGTHRFEGGSLYIFLKTGQGSDIPALRADSLMQLVNPEKLFDITRLRFLDENLKEL